MAGQSLRYLVLVFALVLSLLGKAQGQNQTEQVKTFCSGRTAGRYADTTAEAPYCSTTVIECNGQGDGWILTDSMQAFSMPNTGIIVPAVWNDFTKQPTAPGSLGTFNCKCSELFDDVDSATACTVCMAIQATGLCDPSQLTSNPAYSCSAPFPLDPLVTVACTAGGFYLEAITATAAPDETDEAASPEPAPGSQGEQVPERRSFCKNPLSCCRNKPLATVLVPAAKLINDSVGCSTQLIQCRPEAEMLELHMEPKWGVPFVLQPLEVSATYAVLPGAVGTSGCNCSEAYSGAPEELREAYTLACDLCMTQQFEVDNITIPELPGICTSCLYSGPVPKRCDGL